MMVDRTKRAIALYSGVMIASCRHEIKYLWPLGVELGVIVALFALMELIFVTVQLDVLALVLIIALLVVALIGQVCEDVDDTGT